MLRQSLFIYVHVIPNCNLYVIIDCQKQDCYLPFVDFAEFANFSIIEKKNLIKCKKYNAKEINHDYVIVSKWLWSNIIDRSKVAQHFGNMF